MQFARRMLRHCAVTIFLLAALSLSQAAEKPRLRVDDYLIHAELAPRTHTLKATARVKFTAVEDISSATFELHNALRPTRVTTEAGAKLPFERFSQDSTIRINLPHTLNVNSSDVVNIEYEGPLSSADESPVEGLKLAYVGEDISYLLYPGRWFPVSGYGTNRFTATIHVTVPAGYTVIGSGRTTAPTAEAGNSTFTFSWQKPSFPGTIIVGHFTETATKLSGATVRVYFPPIHQRFAAAYADTAAKEFEYFSSLYGPAPSPVLNIVEIPKDTMSAVWAPEMAAVSASYVGEKTQYQLLAQVIAHQWFGVSVSPATMNDVWLQDGAATFSQARYVESVAGEAGFQEAMKNISVQALAYDNIPLASVGKLDPFSPESQSLSTYKGAMIFSMLRWVMGDAPFDRAMRQFASQFAGKSASSDDLKRVAEQNYRDKLNWFFAQWLDSTGAPEFKNKYAVYRLGNNKGFRVAGTISQDLDLFRMPVELKIDTDGKTEIKRIEVTGTESPFSVETFGRPRHITIDPDNRVLKNSPEVKVRVNIVRGEGLVKQGDYAEALKEFQKALDVNKNSSLAHYRIAEVFFDQHNYQAAANAYRESMNGDGVPQWTQVWSHVRLGEIFDTTGQRERATGEYRQALQTNDNTDGALDEARKYLSAPFQQSNKPS